MRVRSASAAASVDLPLAGTPQTMIARCFLRFRRAVAGQEDDRDVRFTYLDRRAELPLQRGTEASVALRDTGFVGFGHGQL